MLNLLVTWTNIVPQRSPLDYTFDIIEIQFFKNSQTFQGIFQVILQYTRKVNESIWSYLGRKDWADLRWMGNEKNWFLFRGHQEDLQQDVWMRECVRERDRKFKRPQIWRHPNTCCTSLPLLSDDMAAPDVEVWTHRRPTPLPVVCLAVWSSIPASRPPDVVCWQRMELGL